jgi:hypothetical protein
MLGYVDSLTASDLMGANVLGSNFLSAGVMLVRLKLIG